MHCSLGESDPERFASNPDSSTRRGPHAQEGQLSARAILTDQKPPYAKKAMLAVASSMLTAAYFMLRDGVEYGDLGANHFEQRDKDQLAKRLLQRLRDLGAAVEVKAA
jgi:hypothetical protein